MLRDRRSVIASIILPVLLFPVLLYGSRRLEELRENQLSDEPVTVALSGSLLPLEERIDADPLLVRADRTDPRRALEDGAVQAGLELPGRLPDPGGDPAEIVVYYDESEELSRLALRRVEGVVDSLRESLQRERLDAIEAAPEILAVIDFEETNLASEERMAGGKLGAGIPIFLVFLLLNGASYAAVDLFSGEKERKTIETLLTSLADRRSVVTGKFLAVFTVAELTTVLFILSNLVSSLLGLTGEMGRESLAISPLTALILFAVTMPLGAFVSAVLVYVASHSNSYREAQTLILPITFAAVVPAVLGVMPGVRLASVICLVPIANVTVAVREGLVGNFPILPLALVFVSNLVYAGWVLARATRFLESEALILGPSAAEPVLIHGERSLVRQVVVFYFAELLALYYIGSAIQAENLMGGLLITLWVMILVPSLLFARWHRIPFSDAFSLRPARITAFIGAVLLAPATLLLANAAFRLQSRFVPVPDELFAEMEGLFNVQEGNLALIFFAIAISPGICEEMLFRGLLLGRFRRQMPPWRAVVLGGFLFGLFHLSIYRILPTALMGTVAGTLVVATGSIFPAMGLHAAYNGIVVLSGRWEWLASLEEFDLPVVGGAILLAAVGAALLFLGRDRSFGRHKS